MYRQFFKEVIQMANKFMKRFSTLLVIRMSQSVQSLSHVRLFVTSWTAECQAPLSFTISWSLLKSMFADSVTPSNHLILCHPLLLLPSVFSSIYFWMTLNWCYWMLGAGALGQPRGRGWGGRREEGSGWGARVYLWQIHFDVWQN